MGSSFFVYLLGVRLASITDFSHNFTVGFSRYEEGGTLPKSLHG